MIMRRLVYEAAFRLTKHRRVPRILASRLRRWAVRGYLRHCRWRPMR